MAEEVTSGAASCSVTVRSLSTTDSQEPLRKAVLFLVADEGGFITGSTLSINGGQHMY